MPESKKRKVKRKPPRYVFVETTYFGRRYRMKCTPEAHKRIGMIESARVALQQIVDAHDEKLYPQDYADLWKAQDWGEARRAEGEITSNAQFAQMLGQELSFDDIQPAASE